MEVIVRLDYSHPPKVERSSLSDNKLVSLLIGWKSLVISKSVYKCHPVKEIAHLRRCRRGLIICWTFILLKVAASQRFQESTEKSRSSDLRECY
jgi:hypothetical protein